MKLTMLGSGSPKASAERCSSGYLIETGNEKIMMECGPGAVYRLVQAGHKVTDIDKLFLSHLHFDHWLDMLRLVLCRWDVGGPGQKPLQVWGPPGTRDIIEKAFGPDGLMTLDLTARTTHPQSIAIYHGRGGVGDRPWPEIAVTEIDETTVVEGDTWQLGFAEVPHQQPYLISYGMRWTFDEGIFAYSSDITRDPTQGAPEGLKAIAQDADLLVQYVNVFGVDLSAEASEPKGPGFHEMIATMARDAGVGTMITTHQSPHLNVDGVRERIIQEICRIYPGRLIWGRDLLEIEL